MLGRQVNDASLMKTLRDKAGLRVAASSDFPRGTVDATGFGGADGVYLEQLGIAVASSAPEQLAPLMGPAGAGDVLTVERERIIYALHIPHPDHAPMTVPASFDQPFGPASVDAIICTLPGRRAEFSTRAVDESAHTWGLAATKVLESSRTGRGIRIAVLDTGFDLNHPDFSGRAVVSHSFIDGEAAQDGHSHGTHCIGTALGPARPATLPRYGVASEAELFVGKVIANAGRGKEGAVLAAINWAVTNSCRVISMSLGIATFPGEQHSQVYEAAAKRALDRNTLLVAAAGNESDRLSGRINPVGHPANCPSIMAIGAVDSELKIAKFSTRGMESNGGAIDLVGPGVEVYSTVPLPDRHGRKSGTSMACPHVAGIAALYMEANPTASARDIWQMLVRNAKRLDLPQSDMGAGLVQAPR